MKKYDKRKTNLNCKLHMIYISSNNVRHPVPKTFPTLHYTSPNYTSLHFTSLHLSTLHFLSFKLHPTTLHSTSLHLSTLHFLSFKLHPTTLHYPLIWLKPHLNFPPLHFTSLHYTSPHITTLHLPSLHCTFRWFSPHFYSPHFTQFIISFLTLFLKLLGLQGEVPNASTLLFSKYVVNECYCLEDWKCR